MTEWWAVTVENSRVVGLDFRAYRDSLGFGRIILDGALSPSIGDLAELRSLGLQGEGIVGNIPSSVYSLANLEFLNVSRIQHEGGISKEIGKLTKLRSLFLYGESFDGRIPDEIGNLIYLEQLALTANFVGSIPRTMSQLVKLKKLRIDCIELTTPFPKWIGELRSLEVLGLTLLDSGISIPKEIGNLSELQGLSIFGPDIGGVLPPEIVRLEKLSTLRIHAPKMGGILPSEIGRMTELRILELTIPNLTGEIPADIGRLSKLAVLAIPNSKLEGRIPEELAGLVSLSRIDLSGNRLSGFVPDSIIKFVAGTGCGCDLGGNRLFIRPTEEIIHLGFDNICGLPVGPGAGYRHIVRQDSLALVELYEETQGESWYDQTWLWGPVVFWNGVETDSLGRVVRLNLPNKGLAGSIPMSIADMSGLKELILSNNELGGAWPSDLILPPNIEEIDLSANELEGSLPQSIGELNSLRKLDLSYNDFTGEFDFDLSETDLREVYLEKNQLSGGLPGIRILPEAIENLHLWENEFEGSIPSEYGSLPDLKELILYSNNLSGGIPLELGSSQNLTALFLNDNDLTGEIPSSLSLAPMLHRISLANNKLEGTIDIGLARKFSEDSNLYCKLSGNDASLCFPDSQNYLDLGVSSLCFLPFSNTCQPTDVALEYSVAPEEFSVGQMYPNPVRGLGRLSFSLRTAEEASFVLLDNLGRELKRMDLGWQSAGSHQLEIELGDLSRGVYFYMIESGEQRGTGKVTVGG